MSRHIAVLLIIFTISAVVYPCNKKLSPVVEYDKVKHESFVKNDLGKALLDQYGDTFFIKGEKDAQGKFHHITDYRYLRDSLEIHVVEGKKVVIKTNCGEIINKPSKTYIIPDVFIVRLSRKCFPATVQINEREYKVANTTDYSCVQFIWHEDRQIKIFYSNQRFGYL